ncbi:type 2 lanthipeptide synthetase LanM family protein [Streptomyces misionensis]|uniref:type 2 lanthipeptide synthetase LanM family protein n=1 Tax=Streptomyces misionensis TaxID=67331 RepID=UPI0036CDB356
MTLGTRPSSAARVDSNASIWFLAAYLDERVAAGRPASTSESMQPTTRTESATARWRARYPYSDDELFAEILHRRQLTSEEFIRLCDEEAEQVRERFTSPPGWLQQLHGLPLVGGPDAALTAGASVRPEQPQDPRQQQLERLLDLVRPLLNRATDALVAGVRDTVRSTGSSLDGEHLGALLARTWPRRALTRLVIRVLLLELNIARLRGTLAGADDVGRFADFVARLSNPRHSSTLWQTYPVLLRECAVLLDRWVAARLEFCAHLCADLSAIGHLVPDAVDRQPIDARFEAGDGHRGGRSVGVVTFTGGHRVVYKPRSLHLDRHFQELLRWANAAGFEPGFATLDIVSRDDHGWSQFVAPSGCSDRRQTARFYRRHGGYLALAYVLRATDLHFENVIAAGEHPYLVDLEALFGAELRTAAGADDELAGRLMTSTVLATGLLPNPVVRFSAAEHSTTDLSGINYRAGQLSSDQVPVWADPGSDTMHIVHRRVPMGASPNAPLLNGSPINPVHFVSEIVDGFTDLYRILLERKTELSGEGGPLERFENDIVRRVLDATQTYSTVLWDSYHPNLLRNAVHRDRYLDRTLGRYRSYQRGHDIAASERRQLAQGDIPLFTSRVSGRELQGGDGTVIGDALETSGLQAVHDRLRALSTADLLHQRWVIESAFACAATDDLNASWPVHTVASRDHAPAPHTALAHAQAIGDNLLATALRAGDEIGWLGITPVGTSAWRLTPTAGSLYSGAPGIALFLLQLGLVTDTARYQEAASLVARSLARRTRQCRLLPPPPPGVPALGLSGEVDGGLYFAAHWAAATGEHDALAELLSDLAPRLESTIDQTSAPDVVDGLAGTLLGLTSAYHLLGSGSLADLMTRCADAIASAGILQHTGMGWHSSAGGDRPLCGMAHGASGIVLALSRCSQALHTGRYREIIREALRYEAALHDPELRRWPDLRPRSRNTTMTAWCHGAPGIGLARAVLSAVDDLHLSKPAVDDLTMALDATRAAYPTSGEMTVRNLSLCHGELGNLEFVATAADILDSAPGRRLADRIAHAVCVTLDERGPVCGVPEGLSTPGLLTGIAGIGHGLLRLAARERIPSVLTFEPPSV